MRIVFFVSAMPLIRLGLAPRSNRRETDRPLGHLAKSVRLSALTLLTSLIPQDPPKPNPNDFKLTQTALEIWASDGSHCRKFKISNVDVDATSKQEVIIRWSDGTSFTATLKAGDTAIGKECKINSVTARELTLTSSTISCVQT
jgi:hypothetical protein